MFHLVNGDVTAALLKASGISGEIGVWAEILWEGPLPPDGTESPEWREARAEFYTRAWNSLKISLPDARAKLAVWDRGVATSLEHDEVVLWLEHDLFDQLLLIRHLNWYASQGLGDTKLSIICIDRHPKIRHFRGLGQLDPKDLAALLEERRPVTEKQTHLAQAAWRALCSGDPTEIQEIYLDDCKELPFLGVALKRYLEDLPWASDGLCKSRRLVLQRLKEGACDPMTLFKAYKTSDDHAYLADIQFLSLLDSLKNAEKPLIENKGEDLALTALGLGVLDGKKDAIELGAVTGWMGSRAPTTEPLRWRWNGNAGAVTMS